MVDAEEVLIPGDDEIDSCKSTVSLVDITVDVIGKCDVTEGWYLEILCELFSGDDLIRAEVFDVDAPSDVVE